MSNKLSKQKRDNVKSRIIAAHNTANIITGTGVSNHTVLRMKKKIDPNYPWHIGGRPSLLLSSAHTALHLKLRTGQVTFIRSVQTYLRPVGYSVTSRTARNFVKTLSFKCCKKKNTATSSFKQMKRHLKWAR
jgi:transposase